MTPYFFKDNPIIPKFEPYLLELDPNTQSSSLNTILVVSGRHDVIMTFHENFVNWQFVDILHEKSFSNTKSRPLMTFLMVSDRHDVIVTFKDNIVNFFTQNYIRPQIILNELEPFYHFRIWICFKINHKNGIFIVKAWFLVLTFKKVWVRKRRKGLSRVMDW